MTATGSTRVAAVIGSPVRHSLSPVLHNAAFEAAGVDWVFVALDVASGRGRHAVAAMRALQLAGLSVTMPHKSDVAGAVDDLSAAAAELGAVNCVAWDGDRLVGHNTDGDGFLDALRADVGVDPSGRRAVVVGAGGAARAVIRALARQGATEVVVVNRTAAHATAAAALAGTSGRVGSAADVAAADIVVNATPIGMGAPVLAEPDPDRLPVPAEALHAGQVVADLVYQPLVTPLLRVAGGRGATTLDGVGMLLHQAARAFQLWTGAEAPMEAMRAALAGALHETVQVPADPSG